VTIDRALDLSKKCGFPADRQMWEKNVNEIRQAILTRGFNHDLNAFAQCLDSDLLDASVMMIPLVGFLPATDARVKSTVSAIEQNLAINGLVQRYVETDDGLPPGEGTFTLCSFWMVENLALQGEIDKAEKLFERLIGYCTPLRLMAEEVDANKGLQLGNYPQGFSHVGLINAALNLERAREQGAEHTAKTFADRTTENRGK